MNEYTFLVRSVRDALNAGESQRSLAKLAGVSHATVSKLLSGKSEDVSLKTYRILLDAAQSVVGRIAMQPQTLDATVEQLAAERVNADLTHHADWDVDLQCAKYRRVMQLEKELEQSKAEVSVWRKKADKAGLRACDLDLLVQRRDAELNDANAAYLMSKSQHDRDLQLLHNAQDVLAQREQHLKSCENALIEAHEKIQNVLDESGKQLADLSLQLRGANAEIKRLTALSETQGQSWKAACVQAEQLQKQLDHGQAKYNELWSAHRDWEKDEAVMLEQIDTLFAERETTATLHDQQVMRLRVYVWILIAALVFVVASGLVVWGAK